MGNRVYASGTITFANNTPGKTLKALLKESDWNVTINLEDPGSYNIELTEGFESQYEETIGMLKAKAITAISLTCRDDHHRWKVDLLEGLIVRRNEFSLYLTSEESEHLQKWLETGAERRPVPMEWPAMLLSKAFKRKDVG